MFHWSSFLHFRVARRYKCQSPKSSCKKGTGAMWVPIGPTWHHGLEILILKHPWKKWNPTPRTDFRLKSPGDIFLCTLYINCIKSTKKAEKPQRFNRWLMFGCQDEIFQSIKSNQFIWVLYHASDPQMAKMIDDNWIEGWVLDMEKTLTWIVTNVLFCEYILKICHPSNKCTDGKHCCWHIWGIIGQ